MRSHKTKPRVYVASPLFSVAEIEFNLKLSRILEARFDVYLPQRDGGLLNERVKAGNNVSEASKEIFETDIAAIEQSDLIIAVLDGRTVDEGVSIELGYAYALRKKCFGLQTDPRRLLPYGNNPMVENVLEEIFTDFLELEQWMTFRADSICTSGNLKYFPISKKHITKP